MNEIAQYDLPTLLERAGAKPPRYGRGKWRCPKHSGSPSLSVDIARGSFNCHHAGCDFHGSAHSLARQLGLARRLSSAEYAELRQQRERADRVARKLYELVRGRRFELLDELHRLNRLQQWAHDAGPEQVETWDALAKVFDARPGVLAELTILERYGAAGLIRFLQADRTTRHAEIRKVVERGRLQDSEGRFVEIALY